MVQNFKAMPSANPKLLKRMFKSNPQKNCFFWSNLYQITVMITSLIEMQELLNFGHMTTSTKQFESRDKILLVTSWIKIITS